MNDKQWQQKIDDMKMEYEHREENAIDEHRKEMVKVQQVHKAEIKALAEQSRAAVKQMNRATNDCSEYMQQLKDASQYASEAHREVERLKAELSNKDKIIYNLSKAVAHIRE